MKAERIRRSILTAGLTCCAVLGITGCAMSSVETAQNEASVSETADAAAAEPEEENAVEDDGAETVVTEGTETVDLSKIKLPDAEFTRENFPDMNGSTSCVPLGRTLAALLLGEEEDEVFDLVQFSRTTQSFRDLAAGESDLLLVSEPNAAVYTEMEEQGFEYEMEDFATEALVFVVNEDNPVSDLSTDQIRDIYSGKITNWKEVGGNDEPIAAFQRNEGAGSQSLMEKLVMKDTEMMEAPSSYVAAEMGELMEAVKSYDNSANAIGYSVYYYANDMRKAEGLKIISVDGVIPEASTIRSGEYPFLNAYYCVIPSDAEADSPARAIYDWIVSEDGQTLVASKGYVSVLDTGINVEAESFDEPVYTKMTGDLSVFTPSEDYGTLYPYAGEAMYINSGDGYAYRGGSMYGFFDESGRIITDPIYCSLEEATSYDYLTGTQKTVGGYIAAAESDVVENESDGEAWPQQMYRYIPADGSAQTDLYAWINVRDDVLLAVRSYNDEEGRFDVLDISGNLLFDQDGFRNANPGLEDLDTGDVQLDSGEGILVLNFAGGSFYCDREGKILSGSYSYAQPYKEGTALVTLDSGDQEVVDEEGNVLHRFETGSDVGRMSNGFYSEKTEDGLITVWDNEGNEILSTEGNYVYSSGTGFSVNRQNGDTYATSFYDDGGNLLFDDEKGEWNDMTDVGLISREGEETAEYRSDYTVRRLSTGEETEVEDVNSVYPFFTMAGSTGLRFLQAGRYDEEKGSHYFVYDVDTMEVVLEGDGYVSAVQNGLTGEWYIEAEDAKTGRCVLYDAALEKIGEYAGYGTMYGEKFIVNDDHSSTAYDTDGNVLFRYNMIAGDD